jgi:hypothetical protein
MSGADATSSVMMQLDGVGAFVRALLPVKLTGGYTITYGVWVDIQPSELRSVFDTWWTPAYKDLKLTGRLANSIEPWGLLGAPVRLEVLDADSTPYCLASTDARLNRVLDSEWDHELVLSTIR